MGRSRRRWTAEDDGPTGDRTPEFTTYVDEEYGYAVDYPTRWSVETATSSETAFQAGTGSAGATVFVDENRTDTLDAYAGRFLDELRADENIGSLSVADRRTAPVDGGPTGRVIECAYLADDSGDRWRLSYLFVRSGTLGYTVGVDWKETEALGAVAAGIVGSFALTGHEGPTDRGDGPE